MKLKRLLEKVDSFLSAEERERNAKRAEMRKVLEKLKKKERRLKKDIASEDDAEARARLEGKLKVAHAQRRKGLAALKALKAGAAARQASGDGEPAGVAAAKSETDG